MILIRKIVYYCRTEKILKYFRLPMIVNSIRIITNYIKICDHEYIMKFFYKNAIINVADRYDMIDRL